MISAIDGREKLRSDLWTTARLVREAIRASGVQSYVDSLSNLTDAFRPSDRALRCIDRRTAGGIRLAGSGILVGLDKAKAFAEAARADRVTYHEDCGAARMWAQAHGLGEDKVTDCARDFAAQLAAALGVPCEEAPLAGPPGFHDETAIYYDGTGLADPSRASGLPKGFVITRPYFSADPSDALQEVRMAVDIAFGPHGFAALFTPENPLLLIPIGDPRDERFSLEALTQELRSLLLPERVALDGFTAPRWL